MADIIEIGKQPSVFLNAPRLAVFTNEFPPPTEAESRHLLNMDPPDHARYRRVTSAWFTPQASVPFLYSYGAVNGMNTAAISCAGM